LRLSQYLATFLPALAKYTVAEKQSPPIWYLGNQETFGNSDFRFKLRLVRYVEKHTSEVFPMSRFVGQTFEPIQWKFGGHQCLRKGVKSGDNFGLATFWVTFDLKLSEACENKLKVVAKV
jgi:hypothetical protein